MTSAQNTGPAGGANPGDGDGSAVPPELGGVWRRRDLVVGEQVRDDADVLWLQAGDWYADLRIPHADGGGPVEAFAGPSTWVPPHFTWVHDVDWLGSFPVDVGHLEPAGPDLIETGTFEIDGADVPYRERWARSGPAAPHVALVAEGPWGTAVVVQVGPHRIALVDGRSVGGGFAARRDDHDGERWTIIFDRAIDAPPAVVPVELDGDPATGSPPAVGTAVEAGEMTFRVVASAPGPEFRG